jgi:23S rRNA (guanosine2251-2'-O)-methyltransferase
MRPGHPAQRRAQAAARRASEGTPAPARGRRPADNAGDAEVVAGRNPVVEALRAKVPATGLLIAGNLESDPRIDECRRIALRRHVPVREVSRHELDRLTERVLERGPHQGVALQIAPYRYVHPDDLLGRDNAVPLIVALDGITDPRNLGAVIRSAAAFGAHGVVIPERRAAGVTAAAWRTSAGAAARLPVARATNLARTLVAYQKAGLFVVGLAADGTVELDGLETATEPLVLVVGSEGKGLSRLIQDTCDLTVAIPMAGPVESLNASVAASVVLAEVARRRRTVT